MNPWIALSIWALGWAIVSLTPYFEKRARRAAEGKPLPWGAEFTVSGSIVGLIGAALAFSQDNTYSTLYSYAPSDVLGLLSMGMAAAGTGNWIAARNRAAREGASS